MLFNPRKYNRDEDTTLMPKLRVILATLLLFITDFLVVISSLYDPIISGQQQEEEKISSNYLLYECSKAEGYN
jgi:hypothetical protein